MESVLGGAVCERSAQLQDVVLDDLRGRRRRPLAPELVDDAVGRDHLVAMEEEQCEQGALLAAPERDLPLALTNLERPENAEVQLASFPSNVAPALVMGEIPAPVTDPLPPNGRSWTAALHRPPQRDCTRQSQRRRR
jgi:hypothetical protein